MNFKRNLMAWTMTPLNPLGLLTSTKENVELEHIFFRKFFSENSENALTHYDYNLFLSSLNG